MRHSSFALGGLLLALTTACGSGHQGPSIRALPDGQLPRNPVQAAFDSINSLIVADPGDAKLYGRRAQLFLNLDSLPAAQRDLERAVRLDSNNVNLRLRLGDLYYRRAEVAKAQAQFEKAAKLDPNNVQAMLKEAEIQLVLRNYGKSMTLVNDALAKDVHSANAYFIKGWIHKETGDTALAISSLRTAVEQDPKYYAAYMMLGKLSAARHDPLAEQYYATAISLNPRSVEAWYGKGMYEQQNGKDSAALASYAQITKIDGTNPKAWYNSGYVRLEHLHDPQRAKLDFSEAIKRFPGYVDAWYNRGLAMERINELDSAAANYEMVVSMKPDYTLAAQGLDRLQAKGVRIKIREKNRK